MTDQRPVAATDDGPEGAYHDVAVVGDGPAGTALAAALHHRDVDVVLVGEGEPWPATYATWVDDLDDLECITTHDDRDGTARPPLSVAGVLRHTFDRVAVHAERDHVIERGYGVVDNERLRSTLRQGLTVCVDRVSVATDPALGGTRTRLESDDRVVAAARVVVDATGWPSSLGGDHVGSGSPETVAWQTAFGVVLAEPPDGPLGRPTMMDWRPTGPDGAVADGIDGVPTFGYAVPVADGWLVEETVLAARPHIDPDRLRPLLARRLGWTDDQLDARGRRIERVRIPMGVGPPTGRPGRSGIVAFGAAAGMIHPATGYSGGSSLAAAPRVADAIARAIESVGTGDAVPTDEIRAAVWPASVRRTRALHDYGLDVLTRLDPPTTRTFFSTFFALPPGRRDAYLRVSTGPGALAATMLAVFRRAPWSLRRALVSANPRAFAGVAWPRRSRQRCTAVGRRR